MAAARTKECSQPSDVCADMAARASLILASVHAHGVAILMRSRRTCRGRDAHVMSLDAATDALMEAFLCSTFNTNIKSRGFMTPLEARRRLTGAHSLH
jgi:hypothetical protein